MPIDDPEPGATVSKSILVIFPGALGDLICLIPTLRELAGRHPDAPLELMARAELARFASGCLGVSRGHSIDRREIAHLFAAEGGSISAEARSFFGSFAYVYSFLAAGDADFRGALAVATGGRASCFSFRPPVEGHVVAAYLNEIGGATAASGRDSPAARLDYSIRVDRKYLELAEKRLAGLRLEPHRFMIVLPGSGSTAKNWSAENFATLATSLATRIGSLIILGPSEAALSPVFAAHRLPVICDLELAEVAAIARLARCFVGNDSGVSHLAAAVGAPGLAIFGRSDPARWRPLGRARVIRREPLSTLSPAEVGNVLLEIIGETKGRLIISPTGSRMPHDG